MTDSEHRQQAVETLAALIGEMPVAMLTTCTPKHTLRSRPMVNINSRFEGDLWFFTLIDDPKVNEITANPQVNAIFASPSHDRYVSVSGAASVVRDKKRVDLLWTDACQKWFPDGRDDPRLVLLKVDVDCAEYWDEKSGVVSQISGLLKHAFTATAAKESSVEHEKIDWQAPAQRFSGNG